MWTFEVKPDADTGLENFTVTAGSRDVLAWERKTKKTARFLVDNMPMGELYKIAHMAATRQGLYDRDYAEFENTCDLDVDESQDVDPTQPDHTTG